MRNEVSETEYFAGDDWPYYHGDPGGTHYSALKDINVHNVSKLKVAWTYDAGEDLIHSTDPDNPLNSTLESNPLIVGGRLFFVSPKGRLICLDGETGRGLWTFDPPLPPGATMRAPYWVRGVAYWRGGQQRRILLTVRDNLYSVDADSGQPAQGFGVHGHVELSTGMALSSSPGVVYKDLVIVGGTGSSIRAFDVRTGELHWTFNTVPHPGETGYDTWPKDAWKIAKGANAWAGMTLDPARGLIFVPIGEPFVRDSAYGADRLGDNLFGDCVVALDANTGRLVWYFQTVRHDLWDRDLPAQPTLVSVVRDGKRVDAVAQITKSGFVYVLDRGTGKSLFPLIEKHVFTSDVPREGASSVQIEPQLPAPFARQHLTADLLTRRTPQAAAAVSENFNALRSRGLWDPPSEQGTILFPGADGGGEWGGAAFDPETGILYVNSNEIAWILKLKKQSLVAGANSSAVYANYCAGCHGENRAGNLPEFPSLIGVGERLSRDAITTQVLMGGARMPAFESLLSKGQLASLVTYLETGNEDVEKGGATEAASNDTPPDTYGMDSLPKFRDPDGYPAVAPPWGTLNAINLNNGQYAWKIPFGEFPELAAKGFSNTGSENYGGPIATAGGLLFIGATSFDRKFHAYDKRTGKLLWETVLPAAGNATPATYRANGRQFVVIAAGGGRPQQSRPGSKLIAFALPN